MGCRIVEDLAGIAADYDAVLCDVWGCYHDGIRPYPAAVAALRDYRERGGIVILLTNAPRPGASVQRFLDDMGAPRDSYDGIVSSGGACQAALAGGAFGERFLYVGPDRDEHMLRDVGLAPTQLEQAEAILCTGLRDDRTETPDDYAAEIAGWAARGLPMLCANPDIIVDRGSERIWCAGAIAKGYEAKGGRVVWYGKPHRPVYDRCLEVLAELSGRAPAPARVLAIGDGLATDVAGGIAAGLDVVFITGGLAAADLGTDPERPDPALLEAMLGQHGLMPRYAMGRLR